MRAAYLLDTNIITAVLKKDVAVTGRLCSVLAANSRVFVSAVVYYEIARGLNWRGAALQQAAFRQLVDTLEWLEVERVHWEIASTLWADSRRLGISLDDADVILAAQARERQATVVSDDKDFDHMGITRENWVVR
jgi:tRNA(fMet)-specific endonuclease VapC